LRIYFIKFIDPPLMFVNLLLRQINSKYLIGLIFLTFESTHLNLLVYLLTTCNASSND